MLAKHPIVRALVEQEWLFLQRIDSQDSTVWIRDAAGWKQIVT